MGHLFRIMLMASSNFLESTLGSYPSIAMPIAEYRATQPGTTSNKTLQVSTVE
ncbi:hypothetical protein BVI434_280021 [Burkholderia vietnamiensis]|nr:hypothetical protein BVI434_280021 [Burkholderia vietnamiensis]